MVSGPETFVVDPLGPVCWGMGSWIRFVSAHPTDAHSN